MVFGWISRVVIPYSINDRMTYSSTVQTSDSLMCFIKLMKGGALRKHSLHEKTAASVLLKLFISGNEWLGID